MVGLTFWRREPKDELPPTDTPLIDEPDDAALSEATTTATKQNSWLIRVVFGIVGVFGAVIIGLVAAVVVLATQWTPFPVFVRLACNDSQVMWFSPGDVSGDVRGTVTEKLLWQLVESKETIDKQTEPERWKTVQFLFDKPLSDQFFQNMGFANPDSPYKKLVEAKQTRVATTKRVSPLSNNVYQVEYVTADYKDDVKTAYHTWVATISVEYKKTRVKYEDRFMNPFGVVVTKYSIAERQQ